MRIKRVVLVAVGNVVGLVVFLTLVHCASAPAASQSVRDTGAPCDTSASAIPSVVTMPATTTTVALTETTGTVSLCVQNGFIGPQMQTFSAYMYDDGSGPKLIPRVWKIPNSATITATLTNQLPQVQVTTSSGLVDQPTNLHFHGFNVSPGTNQPPYGDNVFLSLVPNKTPFAYSVPVPAAVSNVIQPSGMLWFHPHPHGFTELQVLGGLSGAVIVGDLINDHYAKSLANITEQTFLLKDFLPTGVPQPAVLPLNPPLPLLKTINGVTGGTISINQNETQLWDFANIGADAFFDLTIFETSTGTPVPFHVVAIDGNPTTSVLEMDDLFLNPGGRMQALVQFPTVGTGTYQLWHLNVGTGPWGDPNPAVQLASINVTASQTKPVAIPSQPDTADTRPSLATLQGQVTAWRQIDFEEDAPSAQTQNFYICGTTFDPAAAPDVVEPSAVEEWLITNNTPELHVFHIHQVDFIVEEINGVKPPFTGYQDTVTVPPLTTQNGTSTPGSVVVLIPFQIPGTFVYHCHILGHEDAGMMASICVKQNSSDDCPAPGLSNGGPPHIHAPGATYSGSVPQDCGVPSSTRPSWAVAQGKT